MPKTMNIKKAASALNQNQKQIKAALKGASVTFAAVEKSLGRAQFLLKLTEHKTAKGSPRGLFSAGTMRISAGQIVIVEGSEKLGFEIVARIDDLSDAQKLVKDGLMPADVLASAAAAGALTTAVEEEDDLFDYSEAQQGVAEPSMKGGVKGARRQQESMAAAGALAARLGSSVARSGAGVHVEDAADLSAFVGINEDAQAKKGKKPRPASQVARPPTAPVALKASAVTEMAGIWDNSDEEAADADALKAAIHAISKKHVPATWDDEIEVDIDAI